MKTTQLSSNVSLNKGNITRTIDQNPELHHLAIHSRGKESSWENTTFTFRVLQREDDNAFDFQETGREDGNQRLNWNTAVRNSRLS